MEISEQSRKPNANADDRKSGCSKTFHRPFAGVCLVPPVLEDATKLLRHKNRSPSLIAFRFKTTHELIAECARAHKLHHPLKRLGSVLSPF